jgi:hypothetical protein
MAVTIYYRHLEVPTTIKVEEIDITPLTKEDFEFKFPAFTHVTDHISGISYVTTMPPEQSCLEQNHSVSSLSNKEKEEVLDKYLESSETTNSKDSNVIDAGVKLISKTNLTEKPNRLSYWPIVLAFIFVVVGATYVFTRRKKHEKGWRTSNTFTCNERFCSNNETKKRFLTPLIFSVLIVYQFGIISAKSSRSTRPSRLISAARQ